jgi:hypothetical protein
MASREDLKLFGKLLLADPGDDALYQSSLIADDAQKCSSHRPGGLADGDQQQFFVATQLISTAVDYHQARFAGDPAIHRSRHSRCIERTQKDIPRIPSGVE